MCETRLQIREKIVRGEVQGHDSACACSVSLVERSLRKPIKAGHFGKGVVRGGASNGTNKIVNDISSLLPAGSALLLD